jgi:hypothetical protein
VLIMGRREDLEAELAALDADDDQGDEVTISHQGQSFTGTWKRALGVAAVWGIKLVADPPADDKTPAKGDGKDAKGDGKVTRFVAGRRVS